MPFAGGLAVESPFGAIYSTNITPDPETGIGHYRRDEFAAALYVCRGAYLLQGLGHCGSCHTERGLLFQEKALDDSDDALLSGEVLEGWYAPSLRGSAIERWDDQAIGFPRP